MDRPLITIVGAGPGIGLAVARRFGAEGFAVALVARRESWLKEACASLRDEGIEASYGVADARDAAVLTAAINSSGTAHGAADVLLYNAANIKWKPLLDETADSLAEDFKVNVAGALTAVQSVVPGMQARHSGMILLTGSMFDVAPVPAFGSLSIGKAGLRNLSQSLAKSLADDGIRVAYVSINGRVSEDEPERSPAGIADLFWRTCEDPPDDAVINL